MPVDSKYTDKVITWMAKEGQPVTAPQIAEQTGMSRQAAYQWVESNAWRLREVGTGRNSARAYVLADVQSDDVGAPADTAPGGIPNFKPKGAWQVKPRSNRNAPSSTAVLRARTGGLPVTVGMTLQVVAIRLEGNDVVAELHAVDGDSELTVVIA